MKLKYPAILLAFLLCVGALAACVPQQQDMTEETTLSVYRARIEELEKELSTLKETNFISKSDYEKKIAALETRIAELEGAPDTETKPEGSSSMTFRYRLENGDAVITGFEGNGKLVTVPASLNGHPVRGIGERAFEGKNLRAVILPEGLLSIDWFAFYGCTSLTDVTVPASVTNIGYAVFDGCEGVTIACPRGSFAENYAKSYGLSYINV